MRTSPLISFAAQVSTDELVRQKSEAAKLAQKNAEEAKKKAEAAGQAVVNKPEPQQPWTPELVTTLSISLLVFTLAVLAMARGLLKKNDANGQLTLKTFGLVLILCMSALLMIVGYGKDQLTPIVGLFGAIAGYLLGKESAPVPGGAGGGAGEGGGPGGGAGAGGGGTPPAGATPAAGGAPMKAASTE